MKIIWNLADIPELSELSQSDCARIHKTCIQYISRKKRIAAEWAFYVCGGLGIGLGYAVGMRLGPSSLERFVLVGAALGGGIGGIVIWLLYVHWSRPMYRRFMGREPML